MPGWMSYKLEAKQVGQTTTSDMRIIPLYSLILLLTEKEEEEELKNRLTRVKEESERAGLRLNIEKN